MSYFHYRCGERITLINENCTAVRNDSDFDHGLVISAEPITNDVLFEIKIDRKVNSWSGSLEIGVVDCDPMHFDFPACASKIQSGTWIMSGSSVFKNGHCIIEGYGFDLDKLSQDDRVGVVKTSDGDLKFFINGESQGVAADNIPDTVYAIVDLYGKCVQVTITSPSPREHNNDDCLSGSSVLAIENDALNVTLGGDLSELSMSSSNSLDIRMDINISLNLPEECLRVDKLRFHDRCGSLVKLSNGNRTAERRRPLDEFNNGVVMTHRPLKDSELFEIRIDRLVDKWSGSIEMGITSHNPNTLTFPATMTNMRSGTIMMSGCGILTNGKGTRREYGDFNLDELNEGDRVGMMRNPDGSLHYFINGLDQGIAAQRVTPTIWGVIDLYGMTIKVSIVERDEREEQNLVTRKNTRDQNLSVDTQESLPDYYDRLTFHPNCGTHAEVINNGRTANRPNAADDFNNGVVLTARPLKTGEYFEVRLDKVVTKWAGSIEIGVTTHSPVDLDFPFTMTNVRSGTWMMTGSGIMHNGTIVLEQYGVNLDRLQVSDRVGVVRKENGNLHFFVNGIDQGVAASNVPEKIYGVIDLYGQAVEASIVDSHDYTSSDTSNSSVSNATLYNDLRFHHVHGKNARIVNNGLTALRPRPLAEFNDAIVFSNRPLRDGELFEICLDNIVDRWSGSIELGVTAVRPDDIELPNTATDLCRDTWMLSGSSVMENGKTLKNNYPCDLDILGAGVRLGVMHLADHTLEFYRDGIPQGVACLVPSNTIYAVVDLYGQCAQVSIPRASPIVPLLLLDNCPRSETTVSLQASQSQTDLHIFSEYHGKDIVLGDGGRLAKRNKDLIGSTVVYSAKPLIIDELYEISIVNIQNHLAGSLSVGVTEISPVMCTNCIPQDAIYLTGNELRYENRTIQLFTPNLNWINIGDRIGLLRTNDLTIKIFINGEELSINFPQISTCDVYAFYDLKGSCSSISVTSQKLLFSPINNNIKEKISTELPQLEKNESIINFNQHINYEFYEIHGRNIELSENRTIARRVASYNQGLVIVQPPLEVNSLVQIIIEQLESRWQSSLIIGLVCGPLDRLNLPVNALSLKSPCYVIANDWISINGIKSRSNYGEALSNLQIGDTVGISITETNCLKLLINQVEDELFQLVLPEGQQIFVVFDLYGQCQQIKLIKNENNLNENLDPIINREKADLECCEKERLSSSKLTLPIPSTSMTSSMVAIKVSPLSPLKPIICAYKEECKNFLNNLLIPNDFFTNDDPICYCSNCFKNKSQEKDILNWVKFPLKNFVNISTDKWHTAYYPTKIGAIRCILDNGQPLTKGQIEWCNFIKQKEDDVQVIFYPTLQNCLNFGFKLKDNSNKMVHASFQLLVKPNAYSITREPLEWSTKETGAIALHNLLIQLVS